MNFANSLFTQIGNMLRIWSIKFTLGGGGGYLGGYVMHYVTEEGYYVPHIPEGDFSFYLFIYLCLGFFPPK